MNVLIVDDQPEVVESMVTGVNWKKIPVEQVFTAYSVKEAQSVFERERIDVLLCDIEMPPTNGFALLRWAQERFSGVVCIFLSAHAEFEYAQEAVKLGSFDYILQPAPYAEIEAAQCLCEVPWRGRKCGEGAGQDGADTNTARDDVYPAEHRQRFEPRGDRGRDLFKPGVPFPLI